MFKKIAKKQREEELKKAAERRKRAQEFINDFQALTTRHGLTFQPFITQENKEGLAIALKAAIQIVDYRPEPGVKIKPWSECAQENLETREKCEHEEAPGETCKKCGLNKRHWGEGNKGVTAEYKEAEKKRIEKYKKEEKEKEKEKKDNKKKGE